MSIVNKCLSHESHDNASNILRTLIPDYENDQDVKFGQLHFKAAQILQRLLGIDAGTNMSLFVLAANEDFLILMAELKKI